jgi:hypothetical protein
MGSSLLLPGKITLEIGSGIYSETETHYATWRKKRGSRDMLILSDKGFRIEEPAPVPIELRHCITRNGAAAFGLSHGTRNRIAIDRDDVGRVWFMKQTLPQLDIQPGSVHEVVANNFFSDGYSGYSPFSWLYLAKPRRITTAVHEIDRIVKPGGSFTTTDLFAPHIVRWGNLKRAFEGIGWKVRMQDSQGRAIFDDFVRTTRLIALKPKASRR